MRLYFELAGHDAEHRAAWERRLAELTLGAVDGPQLVSHPDEADAIIEPLARQSFIGGRVFTVAPASHFHRRPDSTFVWDVGDFPTGLMPGVYASLPRFLADPARHRSFCYPLRYNRCIDEFLLSDAAHPFGFVGNVTSGLRGRLCTLLNGWQHAGRCVFHLSGDAWGELFAPTVTAAQQAYAESLRRCRFFLCPRGNGLSSVRVFETMQAARVPVIISDAMQLPECVDWTTCAVVVRESQIDQIPTILAAREGEWEELARNARAAWVEHFGERTLLASLARELAVIKSHRRSGRTGRARWLPRALVTYGMYKLKHGSRIVHGWRRRRRDRST
jgi:hypothetical protein